MEDKITKKMIQDGIKRGIVQIVKNPLQAHGSVCQIGEHWFYFGGYTADDEDPEEFLANSFTDSTIDDIYDAVEGFNDSDDESMYDEYCYYLCYLKENLREYDDINITDRKCKSLTDSDYIKLIERLLPGTDVEINSEGICYSRTDGNLWEFDDITKALSEYLLVEVTGIHVSIDCWGGVSVWIEYR